MVYDVNDRSSIIPIVFNTIENGGNGTWSTLEEQYSRWGGNKKIYLARRGEFSFEDLRNKNSKMIANAGGDSTLSIYNSNSDIRIIDNSGNLTGFMNDSLNESIPGSRALIAITGFSSEPNGYYLHNENYSVVVNHFSSGYTNVDFFRDDKIFSYEREDALVSQTDRFFFDENLSVKNTDADIKSISLKNINVETSQQKVFNVYSFEMLQNDSIKLESPNNDNLKLISYGSAKDYDIEMNLAASTGLEVFRDIDIHLPANSSHTLLPDWKDITKSQLVILQDVGNNGTIDDTLRVENQPPMSLHLTALIEGLYNSGSNEMVSDLATVVLRNSSSPFSIIDSAEAVLDSTGHGTFNFLQPENGTPYYIAFKHRNSLETWSSQGMMFTDDEMSYDFTTTASKSYGENVILKGSKYCFYSGDINQDGFVNLIDVIAVYNDAAIVLTGYNDTDLTGDNLTDIDDIMIAYNNAYNFVRRVRP